MQSPLRGLVGESQNLCRPLGPQESKSWPLRYSETLRARVALPYGRASDTGLGEFDLLHSDERHVAHSRCSDMQAIDCSILIPREPDNVSLQIKVVLI